ncbi:hypothetical protein [Chamaesiphon minutus]|nr:hypothetical protein [Chamaesiphon minutus]
MLNFSVDLPEFGWIGGKFPPNNSSAARVSGDDSDLRLTSEMDKKAPTEILKI